MVFILRNPLNIQYPRIIITIVAIAVMAFTILAFHTIILVKHIEKIGDASIVGGILGAIVGGILGYFSGVYGLVFGSIIGAAVGFILGISITAILTIYMHRGVSIILGGLLGGTIGISYAIEPVAFYILMSLAIILIFAHRIVDLFWIDFIKKYFMENESLNYNILASIINRPLDHKDYTYLDRLLSSMGLVCYGASIKLPNLDEEISRYFGGLEFGFADLRKVSKAIGVEDWIMRITAEKSRKYTIINNILYYVSEGGLRMLQSMSPQELARRWGVNEDMIRSIREKLGV